MGEIQKGKSYKSPQSKLVKFFEKSRDQWKAKCSKAKIDVKRLKNRVRFLENSKEHWKSRVKAAKREKEEELEKLKKRMLRNQWFQEARKRLIPFLSTINIPLGTSRCLCH
jgi:outer membrane murein-binding lipoprotein Lpp